MASKLEMLMGLRLPGYLFPFFHQIDNRVWVQVHISGLNDKRAHVQVQLGSDQITEINIIIWYNKMSVALNQDWIQGAGSGSYKLGLRVLKTLIAWYKSGSSMDPTQTPRAQSLI